MSSRTRTRVAQLMLGLLLFAQGALAVAGCDWLRAAPALTIGAGLDQPPCHEEPALNANLCLAHCLGADQSAGTPQIVVHDWIGTASLKVALADGPIYPAAALRYSLPRPAAPPPRILFQSFLI
ncbi:MAG: hypothetical protein EXR33_08525 [Betaproteobacteria bacterium]|nr:hypothetical protein [Betaproteobacteria bacterium]